MFGILLNSLMQSMSEANYLVAVLWLAQREDFRKSSDVEQLYLREVTSEYAGTIYTEIGSKMANIDNEQTY
jgi:hypothetical protein